MRHRYALAFLASVLFVGCESPRAPEAPATAAVSVPSEATSSAERLKADVVWLASDERRGRRAGSVDAKLVADWIVARCNALGLEPAGETGFLQAFAVPLAARVGETSLVRMQTAHGSRMVSELGKVLPLSCSEGGTAEGPMCFRGFGIESLDQQWDDFAGGELHGAIVVMLRGTPPASEALPVPQAESAAVQHAPGFDSDAALFMKVMAAKRHGAAGVILLQADGESEPLAFDGSEAARAGIPALSAPRAVLDQIVGVERARELCERAAHRDHGDFGAPDPELQVRLVADVSREKGVAYNVLARLPGLDPARTVVIGAHYDHLGLGGEGSLAPASTGQVHNGADDNASGAAAVLELARRLAHGPAPAGDVVFALWSGEELGLLGSEYWCAHPTLAWERVRANVNLDMVGRARAPGDSQAKPALVVLGAGTSRAFEPWLASAGEAAGLALQVNRSGFGTGGSDHMSFMKKKIPVLHFFTGIHADYHRPSDDSDKLDYAGMARVVGLGIDLVARMQAEAELAWNDDLPQEKGAPPMALGPGFNVWFGGAPRYSFEGPGVLVSSISPGSPAEKAGLLAGDVLLQVGDVRIDTVSDYSYALKLYKPGDVVVARFVRERAEQTTRVALVTRAAR